ncbi:MAG: hypothetical protein JST92_06405 [Deltaproteobacteria bacterium]|nr:hypothetical protein [Deltaproteobacteria bacterium]
MNARSLRPRLPAALQLALVLALGLALPARAQLLDDPPPERRLVFSSLFAFRYNPLGLSEAASLFLRQRLFLSHELALQDNFVALGAIAQVSPASARVGAQLEVQPLTVLKLYASAEVITWFGNFKALAAFPSATSDTSDAAFDRLGSLPPDQQNHAATGSQLTFGADVQFKVGPIAVRNAFQLARIRFPLPAGDRVFYDPYNDVVLGSPGTLLLNDLDVLYLSDHGLTVGLQWSWQDARLTAAQFAPGEDTTDPNSPTHRIGPLVAYKLFTHPGQWLTSPTVFLLAQTWLKHRYRTGAETSQAVPFVALGIAFWGDLLPLERSP